MYFWFTFIFHYLESISIIPNMTENKIVIKDINFVWILFIFYINMFFFWFWVHLFYSNFVMIVHDNLQSG